MDGSINDAEFVSDELFRFDVPVELNGVSREICRPRDAWNNETDYIRQAQRLANMFIDNYEKYNFLILQIIQNMVQLIKHF